MGYIDKQPSRMQGQFYFFRLGGVGPSSRSGSKNFGFVLWGLPGGAGSRARAPIHLPLKVRIGRYIVCH
jgi:hypothetical protein